MTWAVLALLGTLHGSLTGVPPRSVVPQDNGAAANYLVQLGDGYASWNAWEAAFGCYRAALLRKPGHPRAQVRVSRALYYLGRVPEAAQWASRALNTIPKDPEAIRVFAGVHLAVGDAYDRSGQPADAIGAWRLAEETLRPLLETNRDDADALRLLATTLMRSHKLDEADEIGHRAVYASPGAPESYLLLAKVAVAYQQPHLEQATGFLKRYIDLAPERPDGYAFLFQTYLQLQKPAEAILTGMAAAEHDPTNSQLLLTCAGLLVGAQRLDDAAVWFRKALDTGQPAAVLQASVPLAQYSLRRGKYADAATYCRLGLAVDLAPPADAPPEAQAAIGQQIQGTKMGLRSTLMQACMAQKDFGGAADALGPLVAAQPQNPAAWNQWIELLLRARRGETLRRALRGLIEQFPDKPQFYAGAITLAVAFGRTAELLPILRAASAEHPNQPQLALFCYSALRHTGHDQEAAALLESLSQRFPGHPTVMREVGMALFARHDYRGAVQRLGMLMQHGALVGQHDADAIAALGWSLQFTGDYVDAAQVFGVLVSPERPEALFDVARQYISAGRFPEAAGIYAKILKERPGLSAALLGQARAIANAGGLAESLPLFDKVLAKDPHNALALRAEVIAYLGLGQAEKAHAAVERYHRDAPKDDLSALLAGDVAQLTHDWTKIADAYLAGLSAFPSSALLRTRLGDLYQGVDERARDESSPYLIARYRDDDNHEREAAASFLTAAELAPTDWYPRWQLADWYGERGEFAQAARYWREVLDRMPDQPWPQRLWLHSLEQAEGPDLTLESGLQWLQGQPKRASQAEPLVDFAQSSGRLDQLLGRLDNLLAPAAKVPPAAPPALRDAFGLSLMRSGRPAEATKWYERAQREDARNPLWATRLGESWEQRGDATAAGRYYVQAAHLAPNDAATLGLVAKVEGATGQAQAAIDRLRQVLLTDPNNYVVLTRLLRQYADQELLPRVLPTLRNLVDGDPQHKIPPLPQAHTPVGVAALAYALELSGLNFEATIHYRLALELSPNFIDARLGIQRLTKRPYGLPPFPEAPPESTAGPVPLLPGAASRPPKPTP